MQKRKVGQIKVTYRGKGAWAVIKDSLCMSINGDWDFEPMPSSRTDDWLVGHRFHSAEAAYNAYLRFNETDPPAILTSKE